MLNFALFLLQRYSLKPVAGSLVHAYLPSK
jgi:hypothetical protein